MATLRTERMMNSAPDYYQTSAIFEALQAAQADEFDSQDLKDQDLQNQLYIKTATWGLKYWEAALGITTLEADPYDIRRSRVLSKWRGVGNFSAELIKSVCEAFTNGEVFVTIDIPNQIVQITFNGAFGIPPNLFDLEAEIGDIIHAHLGIGYTFKYLTLYQVSIKTITEMNATPLNNFAPFL